MDDVTCPEPQAHRGVEPACSPFVHSRARLLAPRSPLASLPLGQHSSRPDFLKLKSGLVSVLRKTKPHTQPDCHASLPACLPELASQGHFSVQPSVHSAGPALLQLPGAGWLLPSQHPGPSSSHRVVHPQTVSFLKARSAWYPL